MTSVPQSDLPAWKDELDAIVGARAHGQAKEILPRLRKLDAKHPNVAEINYQLAWTCDVLDRAADALYFEAGRLDDGAGRLRSRFEQAVTCGGWKGPSAENIGHATQERYGRMCRTRDLMRDLAAKFRWQAQQIRAKAEQQRRAQRHVA